MRISYLAASEQMQKRKGEQGFTLIELSIVLVIIGLIVGGVLVGQDLIHAAEVRATISQIEKYNTAVNDFRGKFNALPGDMNSATATTFGFTVGHNGAGAAGQGDGNGVLDGAAGSATLAVGLLASQVSTLATAYGETGVFWVDLSSSAGGGLIDGSFSLATENTAVSPVSSALAQYLPSAKLGRGNYIYVTEINGTNFYGIENVSNFGSYINGNASMTVAQAYSIDKKIDDGYPTTGTVAAMVSNAGTSGPNWVAGGTAATYSTYTPTTSVFSGTTASTISGSATTCFDNGGSATNQAAYSLSQSNGQGANCALILRFQ